jgi:hypothetical protein
MKVLAWYVDLNGIGKQKIPSNTIKYPYLTHVKKCEPSLERYLNGIKKG